MFELLGSGGGWCSMPEGRVRIYTPIKRKLCSCCGLERCRAQKTLPQIKAEQDRARWEAWKEGAMRAEVRP